MERKDLGVIEMDNVRIIFRNFAGAKTQYNHAGDRNFAVVISDPELAQQLLNDGWNVKARPPRDENEDTFYYLTVKVRYGENSGPYVGVVARGVTRTLDEQTVAELDTINIDRVDLDIRANHYDVNGKQGISAYLKGIKVWQRYNRLEDDCPANSEHM